ncbi:MAG: metallophosphoesterase [Flavobacteriaceae bacterium]|nr:metallophosphoesterase [Flavobacteriaceae bacterium]
MKTRILRYFKHLFFTILVIAIFIVVAIYFTGGFKYGRNNLVSNINNEGAYVFFENDSLLSINYIKGDKQKGFSVDSSTKSIDSFIEIKSYYQLDSTNFSVKLNPNFEIPPSTYSDSRKILAISDIESNYKVFRDFLINNKVIDKHLNWTFGNNHLVLIGDFIDRSYFSTQVLWFIYKLEQDAQNQGGKVHYILGNHEIMNMQGNHIYAKSKYRLVADILGKKQFDFYGKNSFIGRWLNSKNTMEIINGNLFVHAGISPELSKINLNIDEINEIIRANYYLPFYPKRNGNKEIQIVTSSKTSPYWYRGYFKDDNLSQQDVEKGLAKFNAKTVIVGHTIQSQITTKFEGKVIGIDVEHPKDYYKYFSKRHSEALLIEGEKYYRVFENGEKEELK